MISSSGLIAATFYRVEEYPTQSLSCGRIAAWKGHNFLHYFLIWKEDLLSFAHSHLSGCCPHFCRTITYTFPCWRWNPRKLRFPGWIEFRERRLARHHYRCTRKAWARWLFHQNMNCFCVSYPVNQVSLHEIWSSHRPYGCSLGISWKRVFEAIWPSAIRRTHQRSISALPAGPPSAQVCAGRPLLVE